MTYTTRRTIYRYKRTDPATGAIEVWESDHKLDGVKADSNIAKITKKEYQALEAQQIRDRLLTILKPGDTVYCVLRHVSRSGMLRRIDLYVARDSGLVYLSAYAADLLGWKLSDKGGIVVGGCGMDMGFHLVHSLGYAIWPNGTPEPHGMRNGEPDTCGGYALKSRWA